MTTPLADKNGTRRLVALVPALNEEDTVETTVNGLIDSIEGVEVYLIDDGSTDDTVGRAKSAGAEIISMPGNIGKGSAVNTAFNQINLADEDILILIDADLGRTSIEAVKLVGPVIEGKTDMTIAVFLGPKSPGGFGLVKGLARWGIKRFGTLDPKAPLSGQRAMKAGLFRAAGGLEPGFGMETGLTIDVLRQGFSVTEIDTNMGHKETGRDIAGFIHRGSQFVAVAIAIAKRVIGLSSGANKTRRKPRIAP